MSEKHHGERLEDHMFNQVLNEARGNLEGNDLGHVQHDSLHVPPTLGLIGP